MTKIYCKRTHDGYAEASVSIPPGMSFTDLNRIKEHMCGRQSDCSANNDRPNVSLIFGLDDNNQKLKVAVRFNPYMSNDAQLRVLVAFRDALQQLVEIESFDLSGMTLH